MELVAQIRQGHDLYRLSVQPFDDGRGGAGWHEQSVPYRDVKARESGLAELLTLSTQAFTYFQSKGGFSEGTPDDLPPARREKYDQGGRNSKVLVKKLAAAAETTSAKRPASVSA